MKKVLIAEDHQGIGETYKLMLEAQGYEVTLTLNGEQCIREFDAELQRTNDTNKAPFELVILDYHMPYKDGIDVASHILSITPFQRILIASSFPQEIITKSAQNLRGRIELLQKPFDMEQFEDAVEQRAKLPVVGAAGQNQSGQQLILETQK